MAVRFGTAGDFLEYTGGAPDTTAITIVGWLRLHTDRNDYSSGVIRLRNSGDSTTFYLGTHGDGTTLGMGSVGGGDAAAGLNMTVGVWNRIAATVSGTSGTTYGSPTVDGTITTATGTVSGNTPAAKYSIGGRGNGDTAENLAGDMPFLKLYNGVLSVAELRAEWSQILPVRTQGLFAAYAFDSMGNPQGRMDHSGNGRMLTSGSAVTVDGPPIPRQRLIVRPYYLTAPAGSTSASAGHASGTGAANQPTVTTVSNASAGNAAGTGAANAAAPRVSAAASNAAGTGTANAPSLTNTSNASAGNAAGTGAAGTAAASLSPSKRAQATGTATNTTVTITLPTYLTTDYIVLIVASNNGNAQTFGANVTATAITSAGDRLDAYRIVPQDGSQTSFTLTVGASSVFTWWIASYVGVDASATVYGANNQIGNSTSSTVAVPNVALGYIASGNELAISAASVNSTASWTTAGSTIYNTTSGNAALQVQGAAPTAGHITATFPTMDRGNNGSTRNQNSLALVLQPIQVVTANLLTNGSFELGATVATGWDSEETLAGSPTWSVQSSTGVTDGSSAQRLQYTGQGGDTSQVVEIFQAPISAVVGQLLTFTVWMKGTQTNCAALVGVEAFTSGNVYISETDAYLTLTGTSTAYAVTYACPAGTDHVAAYVQFNEVAATSVIDAYMDQATLTVSGTGVFAGNAAGTGAAYQPTISTTGNANAAAGNAAGTGTAGTPTTASGVTAAVATGAGTAGTPTTAGGVTAAVAAGAGSANTAVSGVAVSASAAAGTGAASAPATQVATSAGLAAGTGAAYPPTVSVPGATNAVADNATGVGQAFNATISTAQSATAGQASGTGTASGAALTLVTVISAGHAAGAGHGFNTTNGVPIVDYPIRANTAAVTDGANRDRAGAATDQATRYHAGTLT